MTWHELLRRNPSLRFLRDSMRKGLEQNLGAGITDLDNEAEVDVQSLALLLALQKKQTGSSRDGASAESWERLPDGVRRGIRLAFYLSDAGRVEQVPVDFLRAFLGGGPLDAAFTGDGETGQVGILQEDQILLRVSASLLRHLLRIRSRGTEPSRPDRCEKKHDTP